jgi:hypothetical protein
MCGRGQRTFKDLIWTGLTYVLREPKDMSQMQAEFDLSLGDSWQNKALLDLCFHRHDFYDVFFGAA